MASERDDCIDRIVKASGGKLSRQEAMDALDEILSRAETKGPSWRAIDERLAEAAREMEEAFLERASILKRNAHMDSMKAIGRHKYYDRAPDPSTGMEAKLVGTNLPFAGNRLSVDYQYRAMRRQLQGGFVQDLEREGLDKLFASRAIEGEWAAELHELNKAKGGSPGITFNKDALRIAETIHKWQKASIDTINREGGWVKSYSGYITRTTHDPDRIRRAGMEKWIDDTAARIDIERTFHTKDPAQAKMLLEQLWPAFRAGDHFDYGKPLEDLDGIMRVDFARKASAARELHFKSAADWLAYNKLYGTGSPTETVMMAFDRAARTTALLREFGSQPRLAFEEDIHYLKKKHEGTTARDDFDKAERSLRNRFALFDGTANRPVNRTQATIVNGVMSLQRLAKLGLTPFAMLSDLATKASELNYQGVGLFERWSGMIGGYFQGGANTEKQAVADLLLSGVQARIGQVASRFDGVDTPAGWITRAEETFFRITGISPMTFNQRGDAEAIMARHLGMQRGKAWDTLGRDEQRILRSFEIQKPEWDLLHKVDWHEFESGRTYLTPDVAKNISDADMRAYLVATGALHRDAKPDSAGYLITKGRDDLALKLATYFADRGEFAILEPGAKERAMLYQAAQPGTVLGSALRLFGQFKQFPLTMITKTWGRETYGRTGDGMGRIGPIVELILGTTFFGIMANALNQTVKGQDPTSPWRNKPGSALLSGFVRGGAGSVYGDFLLGEWSRFGLPASATIIGPTFGQIDRLAEFWSDVTHLKPAKATGTLALRIARDNTPFMNMIYTKAAFDYLIYYRLQESINPGFLERMERTMKDKQGIEFWLRPTQVAR